MHKVELIKGDGSPSHYPVLVTGVYLPALRQADGQESGPTLGDVVTVPAQKSHQQGPEATQHPQALLTQMGKLPGSDAPQSPCISGLHQFMLA